MTTPTITLPDTDPDLEAWLDHKIEKPCEAKHYPYTTMCGLPAEWLIHVRFDGLHNPTSAFLCQYCHAMLIMGLYQCCDQHPTAKGRVTWIERIRKPKSS